MISKYSDVVLKLTLREPAAADGTPGDLINYTTLMGLTINFYRVKSEVLIRYSKNVPSPNPLGYNGITETDPSNGVITIFIPRSITKRLTPEKHYLSVKISEENIDPELLTEDDEIYSIATDIEVDLFSETPDNDKQIPV